MTVCRVKRPCGLVVSIGSPSERKSAPFASSVSIGAGSVRAEDFSATEVLKIQDLPLGGLVLRTHSGVSDDGYGPIHAEGLAGGFAAGEPPFPKLGPCV